MVICNLNYIRGATETEKVNWTLLCLRTLISIPTRERLRTMTSIHNNCLRCQEASWPPITAIYLTPFRRAHILPRRPSSSD